jgi:hypothetical protein
VLFSLEKATKPIVMWLLEEDVIKIRRALTAALERGLEQNRCSAIPQANSKMTAKSFRR